MGSYTIQRFPITREEIARVMDVFYARVRTHPELGPVFNAHIGETDAEWTAHIAKIDGFWRNALLREPAYDGNPMAVHVTSSDIKIAHFAPWLEMFDATLHEVLRPETAESWSAMAHRIGSGFKWRMQDAERAPGAPPILS